MHTTQRKYCTGFEQHNRLQNSIPARINSWGPRYGFTQFLGPEAQCRCVPSHLNHCPSTLSIFISFTSNYSFVHGKHRFGPLFSNIKLPVCIWTAANHKSRHLHGKT